MELLIPAFLAGILTILAPCTLPLLPIIIGGTAKEEKNKWQLPLMVGSLMVSVFIFTLLLRVSTEFIGTERLWERIAGSIVVVLGFIYLIPDLWDRIALRLNLSSSTNKLLGKASQHSGASRSVLVGAALGPVFNSCSPTYAFIVAITFQESFAAGVIDLTAYVIGLGLVIVAVAYGGQRLVNKLKWATDPKGWFKRSIGILFIVVGLLIFTGAIRDLQAWLIESGVYEPISNLEEKLN
jgi:cytochrome c-type biogenesis protein